jgi:hypothetical protein
VPHLDELELAIRSGCHRCKAEQQPPSVKRPEMQISRGRRHPPDLADFGHSASLAADLGYGESTIASLLGHKTHFVTNRYVHSADAVLLAAADAVANATTKLMGDKEPDLAQPQLRDQGRDGSVAWDGITSL